MLHPTVGRESTLLLQVNFDPDLVRLLREVRYFSYLTEREVPSATIERPPQRRRVAKRVHTRPCTLALSLAPHAVRRARQIARRRGLGLRR